MYTIVYKPSKAKAITLIILCLIFAVGICKFISLYFKHSTFVSVLVVGLCVIVVVRAVGFFVMYPGTYRYLTAQIQKNENDYMLTAIHKDLTALQGVCIQIISKKLEKLKCNYLRLYGPQLLNSFRLQLNMLVKSQTQSSLKIQLIQAYKDLIKTIQAKVIIGSEKQTENANKDIQNWISIHKILANPNLIVKIQTQNQFFYLKQISQNCQVLCMKIWSLCTVFAKIQAHEQESNQREDLSSENLRREAKTPPINVQKWEIANWHLHEEKLFTINSYFAHWDKAFQYSVFMVPVEKGNYVECAIIHEQKNNKRPLTSKRGILFCNPNGTVLQSFALTSNYMNFYLKMGFQIVLWNYRGYANSTGFATVKNCIQDVYKVYEYVLKTFNIKVEVLHGYSIGGIAAINLAHKLNSGSSRPIKLLIADRTLSSIDRVAGSFVKNIPLKIPFLPAVARPIVKTFFHSECIDNSQVFVSCQCQKLIIYDTHDEVISNKASLKFSILENLAIKENKNRDNSFKYAEFNERIDGFTKFVANLYMQNRRVYQSIMRIIYDTDGAGKFVHIQMEQQLENGKKNLSYQEIKKQSEQYFIGLIIYGPKLCLPYYSNCQQEQSLIQAKIERKIKSLQQYKLKLTQNQASVRKQVCSIIQSFIYAKSELSKQKMREKRKIFGELIVSEVGHNNQLKQWWQFERLLNKSLLDNQNITK